MAKGCVDLDADYCLFTAGLGARDRVNLAIDEADLVISLGFDMVEYHPRVWNPNADKRIVHADFLPAEVDAHYHPEVELVGDLAHLLWMLNERVDRDWRTLSFDLARQRGLRDRNAGRHRRIRRRRHRGHSFGRRRRWSTRAPCSARRTSCYQMSAPTRCGSPGTTTATRRIPA